MARRMFAPPKADFHEGYTLYIARLDGQYRGGGILPLDVLRRSSRRCALPTSRHSIFTEVDSGRVGVFCGATPSRDGAFAMMRRTSFAAASFAFGLSIAVAGLSGCTAGTVSTPRVDGGWPMYQRFPDHNAVVAHAGFAVSWQAEVGGRINGGLAVTGHTVFVDTLNGDLLALKASTGAIRWRAHVDGALMSTPIVTRGLAIVGSGMNLAAQSGAAFAYAGGPKVGAPPWGRPQGDHIVAFDAASGRRMWSYRTAGEDMPSPATLDGRVVFANGDFHAYGLDSQSGVAQWRTDLDGVSTMASATAIGPDTVLVSVCGDFRADASTIALRGASGAVRWRSSFGSCDASPTVGASRLFLSGSLGSKTPFGYGGRSLVTALDPRTGRLLWSYVSPLLGPYTAVASSERAITGTYADGLYFQSLVTADEMVAFTPDGSLRWRFKTVAPVKMSPVIASGRLYVGDTSGLLYVLDAKTGRLLHARIYDRAFSTSPPVIVGKTLLVANGTSLYAIPLASLNR